MAKFGPGNLSAEKELVEKIPCPICDCDLFALNHNARNAHVNGCLQDVVDPRPQLPLRLPPPDESQFRGLPQISSFQFNSAFNPPLPPPLPPFSAVANGPPNPAARDSPFGVFCPYSECGKIYEASDFPTHVAWVHASVPQNYACPICYLIDGVEYRPNAKTNLINHLRNNHSDIVMRFPASNSVQRVSSNPQLSNPPSPFFPLQPATIAPTTFNFGQPVSMFAPPPPPPPSFSSSIPQAMGKEFHRLHLPNSQSPPKALEPFFFVRSGSSSSVPVSQSPSEKSPRRHSIGLSAKEFLEISKEDFVSFKTPKSEKTEDLKLTTSSRLSPQVKVLQDHGNPYMLAECLEDSDLECPICFSEFLKSEKTARLPCLCFYHQECIDQWFAKKEGNTCPFHAESE